MKTAVVAVFALLFAFFPLTEMSAQFYDITFANLPADAAYRRHIDEFLPLSKYVAAWSPEWTANIPKAKVVSMMQSLLQETNSFVAKDKAYNIDLRLFQVFLKFCLYNTNLATYHDEIVKDLSEIKKKFPQDYRASWMLANHYGFADNPYASLREYERIFSEVLKGKGSQGILADYINVCFFSFMFARSKAMIDDIIKQNKISDPAKEFWLYEPLLKLLQDPPRGKALPENELYTPQAREFEVGFLGRPLGIWLPTKETWTTQALGLTAEGGSYFRISYPVKNAKGNELPVAMNVVFQAAPKQSFGEFQEYVLALGLKKQESKEWKARWPATVYEFWDPESYKQNGGGRGFIIFIKRPEPAIKGVAVEAPAKFPSKGGDKLETVVLGEGYTRFNGEIYYAFILSCAEEVFPEMKKEFFGFMDRVLLD